MLTEAQNQRLTQVGKGTPMGELFRRYWQPVAAAADLQDDPVKEVHVLGETLVLYRDRQGRLGLVGERCSHRGTALVYGIPEEGGLRCAYHGWLFDGLGQCIEQPDRGALSSERGDARYSVPAYPVQELGGLIFAYLGPTPAPLLPYWEPLVEADVLRSIGSVVVPCNWLQCMENGLDESHVRWLHGYFGNYMLERQGRKDLQYPLQPHAKFAFQTYEFGMLRTHAGTNDRPSPIIFPNITGGPTAMLFRVPIDDTHTWAIQYRVHQIPAGVDAPPQETVQVYYPPLPGLDEKGQATWPVMDVSGMQDVLMWHARGPIADRSTEDLDEDDQGIVLHRQLLEENMLRVDRGEDPIGVVRDPSKNACIRLGQDPEDARADRPRVPGTARAYAASPNRYDPVATQIRQLAGRSA